MIKVNVTTSVTVPKLGILQNFLKGNHKSFKKVWPGSG
jgi:hypothetical protein